jgi:hypothetical protein
MAVSSSGERLYRSARRLVILAGVGLILGQVGYAQFTRRETAPKTSKGPRAVGLLELAPNGKAHLLPICILYDGQYYDASVYKASPVPMALESGTVYEAVKTGASLGLFTVTGALQTKNSWLGAGTWQPAGSIKSKKKVVASKPPNEDTDAPPVLRRSESAPAKLPEPAPQPKAEAPPATPPPPTAPPDDNDHPILKRGEQPPFEEKEPPVAAKAGVGKTSQPATVQFIPAVSDAHGPDPLPYKYILKPEEEAAFRKKMLALAADLVTARAKALAAEEIPAAEPPRHSRRAKTTAKPPQPAFENIDLRIFDLTNSNEPILVLTATAHMPETLNVPSSGLQYFVTLVARNDIYGDLHKAFVNISDTRHLDILPRMELIDAVDADGDGRGELLFRQTSDAGNAFVIYRVIGDSLYPLYQSTPTGG